MSEQLSIINLDALREESLTATPFPFVLVPNFLNQQYAEGLNRDFPKISSRGSFPLSEVEYGGTFERLVEELNSPLLKAEIARKFDINLNDRFTMITVRGIAGKRDGRIHADTKSKFLTLLLYLNPTWEHERGRLRILKNGKDLDDYLLEIPPVFGTCLIFKVTPDCWHGHTAFIGPRRVLQLNYIRDEAARDRHILRHSITAKLKKLQRRLGKGGS